MGGAGLSEIKPTGCFPVKTVIANWSKRLDPSKVSRPGSARILGQTSTVS